MLSFTPPLVFDYACYAIAMSLPHACRRFDTPIIVYIYALFSDSCRAATWCAARGFCRFDDGMPIFRRRRHLLTIVILFFTMFLHHAMMLMLRLTLLSRLQLSPYLRLSRVFHTLHTHADLPELLFISRFSPLMLRRLLLFHIYADYDDMLSAEEEALCARAARSASAARERRQSAARVSASWVRAARDERYGTRKAATAHGAESYAAFMRAILMMPRCYERERYYAVFECAVWAMQWLFYAIFCAAAMPPPPSRYWDVYALCYASWALTMMMLSRRCRCHWYFAACFIFIRRFLILRDAYVSDFLHFFITPLWCCRPRRSFRYFTDDAAAFSPPIFVTPDFIACHFSLIATPMMRHAIFVFRAMPLFDATAPAILRDACRHATLISFEAVMLDIFRRRRLLCFCCFNARVLRCWGYELSAAMRVICSSAIITTMIDADAFICHAAALFLLRRQLCRRYCFSLLPLFFFFFHVSRCHSSPFLYVSAIFVSSYSAMFVPDAFSWLLSSFAAFDAVSLRRFRHMIVFAPYVISRATPQRWLFHTSRLKVYIECLHCH